LDPEIRNRVLQIVKSGGARVFTDPKASPTGFPFKVLDMENSMSEAEVYESRPRICDLGYLRTAYRQEDGSVGYRCAAEPLDDFVRKGGNIEDTVGRKCICNGLMSAVGIGQVRKSGEREPILITCGDDVAKIVGLLPPDSDGYSAEDVVRFLRG
jgi:nitronate monooxygenase